MKKFAVALYSAYDGMALNIIEGESELAVFYQFVATRDNEVFENFEEARDWLVNSTGEDILIEEIGV